MGEVIRFIKQSERERDRLIREARAMYDSVFPPSDPVSELSLSETLSGRQLTENRAMLLFNEGSFQAHWLGGCRSIAAAGSARGRDLDIAAANKRSAADCS